jgi:hypothetical protein
MAEKFQVPDGALPKQFCIDHIATVENPEGTDCTESLAEGVVKHCPYGAPEEAKKRCISFRLRDYGADSDFDKSKIFAENQ